MNRSFFHIEKCRSESETLSRLFSAYKDFEGRIDGPLDVLEVKTVEFFPDVWVAACIYQKRFCDLLQFEYQGKNSLLLIPRQLVDANGVFFDGEIVFWVDASHYSVLPYGTLQLESCSPYTSETLSVSYQTPSEIFECYLLDSLSSFLKTKFIGGVGEFELLEWNLTSACVIAILSRQWAQQEVQGLKFYISDSNPNRKQLLWYLKYLFAADYVNMMAPKRLDSTFPIGQASLGINQKSLEAVALKLNVWGDLVPWSLLDERLRP